MLAFARRCPQLERLVVLVSTLYASGLRAASIAEAPLRRRRGFANHYEWSKWEAEQLLLDEFADLPWRLSPRRHRDRRRRERRASRSTNAVHNTLKLLFHGLLSLVPGRAATPVYFVTGEFVVEAVLAALAAAGDARIFHACHAREESLTLGELIDVAFAVFEEQDDFRAPALLRPLFADAESFDLLVGSGAGLRRRHREPGAVQRRAVRAPALRREGLDNRRLRAALPGYAAPDPKELVERTCAHLVRTRWGRDAEPPRDRGAMRNAATRG